MEEARQPPVFKWDVEVRGNQTPHSFPRDFPTMKYQITLDRDTLRELHATHNRVERQEVEMDELRRTNQEINGMNEELRSTMLSLEREHRVSIGQMVDGQDVWTSNVKWSCIVGAVSILITALVMSCGFRHYNGRSCDYGPF